MTRLPSGFPHSKPPSLAHYLKNTLTSSALRLGVYRWTAMTS